jgi:hypothetical protein
MDTDSKLRQVAETYKAEGYRVLIRPTPDQLPDFAKDFHVEILALRNAGGVIVSVKETQAELERDRDVPKYAEVTGNQPGWRYDVIVLGPQSQPEPEKIEAAELTDEDMVIILDDTQKLVDFHLNRHAFISAWGVLETAMRRRIQAEEQTEGDEERSWWSPRTLLNEVYSAGGLSRSDYSRLEKLIPIRNAIVHGFSAPEIEPETIQFLIDTARRLVVESTEAKKTG